MFIGSGYINKLSLDFLKLYHYNQMTKFCISPSSYRKIEILLIKKTCEKKVEIGDFSFRGGINKPFPWNPSWVVEQYNV